MSLFLDPEVPPPLTKGGIVMISGSDCDSDSSETGFKGLAALCVLAAISVIGLLYARERVNTIIASSFPQYYFTEAAPMAAQIDVDPLLLPVSKAPPKPQTPPVVTESPEAILEKERQQAAQFGQANEANEVFEPMDDMILHYLWCGNRFLDFRNYVAMKSAIEAIRPRQIYFHYEYLPMSDPDGYFTWFTYLQEQYSNIVLVKLNKTVQPECRASGYKRYILVLDILERHGGIYIPDDAIFLRIPDRFRFLSFVSGITSCSLNYFSEGIVLARKDEFTVPSSEKLKLKMIAQCNTHHKDVLRPCASEANFRDSPESQPSCVRLQTTLFPKDVWNVYNRLANLTKTIVYGRTDVSPRRSPLPEDRIPRIAHYLCTDDCKITFSAYLSILSALHVGGLDRVLLHGPTEPSGIWWQRLQAHQRNTVLFLHRDPSFVQDPSFQMTNEMRRYIMRAEILAHYGGVFHDSHVIWTRPLPDQLLEYETVLSPDWHAHGSWPESLNHALFIARGGARYLQRLIKMFYDNAKTSTPWLAEHYYSYRLIEMDPSLAYLYPHLQVKCFNHNCHPTWQPNYRSNFQINRPGGKFDWRTETLSVHWVDSFPELDVDQVKFSKGVIVDIARRVLEASSVDVNVL